MSKKTKEYPLSDDIIDLITQAYALEDVRDVALRLPAGYKRARKAAIEAQRLFVIFWDKVRDVYPELYRERLNYRRGKITVAPKEEGK